MTKSSVNRCAAILLAGGSASRMGTDKRFLKVGKEQLLTRQVRILKEYFEEVIISANDPEALKHLGVPIIPDSHPGRGPLEGLTSALAATHAQYSFVVAVDIPEIDMDLVERMKSKLDDVSAVIPVSIDGLEEPLFAFYSKNCVPIFKAALERGERAVHRALKQCPVYHFPLGEHVVFSNLNSPEDYRAYQKKISTDG